MTRFWKYGAPLLAVFWLCMAVFALVLSTSYDGGVRCFLRPKGCKPNQPEVAELPPTPTQWPTMTMAPTPTQWPTPTLFETPTPEVTATPEEVFVIQRDEFEWVDCGRNPYKYNHYEQEYERPFTVHCFEHTDDPFDAIFGGNGWEDGPHYGEVQVVLNLLELTDLSHEQQVQGLAELGIWNYGCSCAVSPERLNEILHQHLQRLADEDDN